MNGAGVAVSGFHPASLIAQLQPFAGSSRTWIAFSGGLDSTVLLAAAASVRARLPGELRAIHVDHGLHPQSAHWAESCRALCERLGVPLEIRRLALSPGRGESLEAVARDARYRLFATLLGPGDPMLTAHNQDDQAETLLLALVRGSGVQGLAAMPSVAPLAAGYLVRPLLSIDRASLSAYAREQGLRWIEDPSNASDLFDRNYLRHQVMPLLRERWPAMAATLSRSARHCAEAVVLVEELAAQTLTRLAGTHPGALSIPDLLDLERPRCKAVMRHWLNGLGFAAPDAKRLDRILDEVLAARPDADPLVAWAGCEIRRYRKDLFALAPLPTAPSGSLDLAWTIQGGCGELELPLGLGCLSWLDPDVVSSTWHRTLAVRFGSAGVVCRSRVVGASRPLKALYHESGVPGWLRGYVPLVFEEARLLAVAGVSTCGQPDDTAGSGGVLRWSGHPWESLGIFRRDCATIGR